MAGCLPLQLLMSLTLPLLLHASSPPSLQLNNVLSSAKVIDGENLKELIKSPHITVVYYFMKDGKYIRSFLEEYDKSARYLQAYNVNLAVLDCSSDKTSHENCKKETVDKEVYTYRNGMSLLTLELDTMFDVNSIMSNILQLVLLHEVPIIVSRLERHDLQKSVVGQHDIIFAFPQSLGTQKHRIFMEIAYTFQDRFKFAVTTDFKNLEGLQDSELLKPTTPLAMWVLLCSLTTPEEIARSGDCRNIRYQGETSLAGLALFMKGLSEQMLHHCPADGQSQLFNNLTEAYPTIYLYTSAASASQTDPLIDVISFELKGLTKLVVVDMDNADCRTLAEKQGHHGKIPAISVRHQTGYVTFMEEERDLSVEEVHDFVAKFVYPEGPTDSGDTAEIVHSTDLDTAQDSVGLIDEVETQDDQVAEAVFRMKATEINLDLVPALTKSTFYDTVKRAELLIVLFYLPFDHVGMAFLRDYAYASHILSKNFSNMHALARVNCFDATDLCGAENVTTYPVLRIYQKGKDQLNYKGPLDSTSIVKAFKLQEVKSPVLLNTVDEAEGFLKGEYPQKFDEFTPSSVLLLASETNSDVEQLYREVARPLSIFTALAIARGDVAKTLADKYKVPDLSVLAHHRSDAHRPIRSLTGQFSASALTDFIKQSIITTVPELTMTNFPTLFALKKPFTILFLDPADPQSNVAREMFSHAAMLDQFDSAIFCWMNARPKTIGQKVLSEYTWTATLPMITVVSHGQGQVFNYQAEELKLEEVTEWLTRVLAGQERPSKMLQEGKWVAPGKFYNFLEEIKKESGLLDDISGTYPDIDSFEEQEEHPMHDTSVSSDSLRDQSLNADNEIREELLELQNSRLYHHSSERRDGPRKQPSAKQEPAHSHSHEHVEL